MISFLGLCFSILFSLNSSAADCGIKPKGMEFGPNCELTRVKQAPAKSTPHVLASPAQPAPSPKQKRWESLQLGGYSGKPGYYVKVGTDFQLKLDAIVMTEETLEKVEKATAELNLGGVTTCQGVGLQQSIGYTLFDIRNCEEKKH